MALVEQLSLSFLHLYVRCGRLFGEFVVFPGREA